MTVVVLEGSCDGTLLFLYYSQDTIVTLDILHFNVIHPEHPLLSRGWDVFYLHTDITTIINVIHCLKVSTISITGTLVQLPMKCHICDKVFPSVLDLAQHELTHREVKARGQLQCPMCPATFTQSGSRNRHLRTVHKLTPYEASLKFGI